MKNILKIQLLIFIILTIISLLTLGNVWLPLIMILSVFIGPPMAYYYPWNSTDHVIITVGLIVAGVLMFYGFKKRELTRGVLAFIVGYWIWTAFGLLAGLSTGT